MKKAFRIIKITVRTLVLVLVALLLAYNIYTLVMRYACGVGIPTVFGYGCAVVETGSMEPAIGAGDFIIVHAEEEYAVGDVITFYDSARGEYVTHRIILVTESGYTTKGDANNVQDNFTVPQSAVVGRVVAVMNGLGSYLIGRRAAKKGTAAEHASGAEVADGAGAETENGAPAEARPADETGETDKE